MSDFGSLIPRRVRIAAITTLAVFCVACASAFSGFSVSHKDKDATLYQRRCGSCHSLFPAQNYSDSEWEVAVKKMAPRAELTANEQNRILRWLQTHN